MGARVHDFDGSQQSANVFRHIARAGAWAGIADNDALEEKFQSRLKRIVQCTAPAFSPTYWRMCPRAGTLHWHFLLLRANADSTASIVNHYGPPVTQRTTTFVTSGTSNA